MYETQFKPKITKQKKNETARNEFLPRLAK
jgi:hypothetical protein